MKDLKNIILAEWAAFSLKVAIQLPELNYFSVNFFLIAPIPDHCLLVPF